MKKILTRNQIIQLMVNLGLEYEKPFDDKNRKKFIDECQEIRKEHDPGRIILYGKNYKDVKWDHDTEVKLGTEVYNKTKKAIKVRDTK